MSKPMFELDNYDHCYDQFTIEGLKQLLSSDKLHPMFKGDHITPHGCCEAVEFFGNFVEHSYVFRFNTRDKKLIKELTKLINENLKRNVE